MHKKLILLFLIFFTFTIPILGDDDDGCESWVLKGAGGVISGVDLSGKDFITSGISTVVSDTELLQGNATTDYEKLLKEHTTFIMADHQEKTVKGYKDNIITVQAVGVATNGFDIWKSNNISTNEQGAYLNLPFKGSAFKTFHLPRSQYGQTETRVGSDGKSYKVCEYYPINDARIEQVEKFIDKYTHSTMKGVFLASLNRVANVYTFMSTEQVPLTDILQTSDNTTYTMAGGSQTSSLIYTFQASVFPFSEGLVEDVSVFESPNWEDSATKQFMKKDYFFTGLDSLSSDDVKAYDKEVEDKKSGFKGLIESIFKKDSATSIDSYLSSYNSVVSEYKVTVSPSDFYKGFIDGTSAFGKYIRFIDNTAVPVERRTGGITEFNYKVNDNDYIATPTDWVSFILPLYVPGEFIPNADGESYTMGSIQPLDDYYLSLLDLKILKKNGENFDLVGTITSYGDISLNDLYLYNNGEEGVILLSKFQEGIFIDGELNMTGRSLKLRGDYSSNLKFRDGNLGKFDYLNVENQADGVESMFFAFDSTVDSVDSVHKLVDSGNNFKFMFKPNFGSGLDSGVVMVRNNTCLRVPSLTNFLNSTDKNELLKKVSTKVPIYSTDVDYETHSMLVDLDRFLKIKRITDVETFISAIFIFAGFLLIIYSVFLVLAYVFDMLGDVGAFNILTFKQFHYADDNAIKGSLGGDGSKPLKKVEFGIRVFVIILLGIFLINSFNIMSSRVFNITQFVKNLIG